MPAPTSAAQFLELVRRSDLLAAHRLADFLAGIRAVAPADMPLPLAQAMVRAGLLTRLQATQLLAGKWRNFILADKYRFLEHLGGGAMGHVYLCEHVVMRRLVALKVLHLSLVNDRSARDRFVREARASALVQHPNVVRAFDTGHDRGLHFLVLEFIDGRNLHEIVKRRGPLNVERATRYIAQAAAGLHHAHARGLVHRDIKPANLILDREGVVKILDLGVALLPGEVSDESGSLLGTADYLAPEQALDSHGVDGRADVYGLGMTFYFLLTGRNAFEDANSVQKKLIWHQTRDPVPVSDLCPHVPHRLTVLLGKMTTKDPAQRFQSPAEVVEVLKPWTRTPIPPPPAVEMPRYCAAVRAAIAAATPRPAPQVVPAAVGAMGPAQSSDALPAAWSAAAGPTADTRADEGPRTTPVPPPS